MFKLGEEFEHKTIEKDNLQRGFDQAYDTYCSRMANNTYTDKKRQILVTWREYVKREKNACNVIGAIARRTLRIEVFQRIRMAAREKFLDNEAERICNNFWRMFHKKQLMRAMVRWKAACLTNAHEELKFSVNH